MKKVLPSLFFVLIVSLTAQADVLFEDASNYPYANGSIETQGQWYCYNLAAPYRDAQVTNNVLLLNATNHDAVAAPVNGWSNSSGVNFASFMINVSQLPSQNGDYFCQLQDPNDANDCCHVFIDTRDTSVPGTYRLGIAAFDKSFSTLTPPDNYQMDLATDVWYSVVILFDTNQADATFGANLFVNPSLQDYENDLSNAGLGGGGAGTGYVFALDMFTAENTNLFDVNVSQIGFSPNADAGISNVIAGTEFSDVLSTNAPVFGIQPQNGTNYLGNSFTLYAVASGVDLGYQWFDQHGPLSDGTQYAGSASDILVATNIPASDTYYCVVTDAYGTAATSLSATETIITNNTPVFFPASETAITNFANEFNTTGFTNVAAGTGPISYQWYFAAASTPTTYTLLRGQTSPVLSLSLDSTTNQGNYYVAASSSTNVAFGPTNSLIELPALTLNMMQLHTLIQSYSNQIAPNLTRSVYIGTNNVTVTGYVVQFEGFGSADTEYYIEDASGLGAQVYLQNAEDDLGNSLTPPIGTCVTVTGQLETRHNEIAIAPGDLNAVSIVTNAPAITISPKLANGLFDNFVTNGLGTNAFLYNCSLVTLTNVYLYGDRTGDPVGNAGVFYANSYTTAYITAGGPYNPATGHTNMLELYQFGYDYPALFLQSEFDDAPVPTNCFQLTGIYVDSDGTGKLEPSRPADYVGSPPLPFAARLTDFNGVRNVSWPPQAGSTYSVYSATSVLGPWTQTATGLAYYPTNGTFTDANSAPAKFYYISSP